VDISEEETLFELRDDYWGANVEGIGLPEPKWIQIIWVETVETTLLMLERHEISCFSDGMNAPAIRKLKQNNPYIHTWYEDEPWGMAYPVTRALAFNQWAYPINYTEVRHAISLAVDRETVASVIFGDMAVTTQVPPFPGWNNSLYRSRWYFPDLMSKYNYQVYDPERAAAELESIGFYKEDGLWHTSTGDRVEFRLNSPAFVPEFKIGSQVIASQLLSFGFVVTLDEYNAFGTWFDVVKKGDFDIMLYGFGGRGSDIYYNLETLHSRHYVPLGELGDWPTYVRFVDPTGTYDDMLEQIEQMNSDGPGYDVLVHDMLDIVMEQWFADPIYYFLQTVVWDGYYWTGLPDSEDPYVGLPYWENPTTLILHRITSNPDKPWIETPTVEYSIVWFTSAVEAFTGVDGESYGPFSADMSALIPSDDGSRLVDEGKASLTAPFIDTVNAISTQVAALSAEISDLSDQISGLAGVAALTNLMYAAIALEVIVLVAVVAVLLGRK
jgi:ABC-type transport system substrate-binding protein